MRNPSDDAQMVGHIQEILAEVGGEEEQAEAGEGIELEDEDQEHLEKVANILDAESEDDSDNKMES